MNKFYFINNTLKYNKNLSHGQDIKQTGFEYDIIIRGIIFKDIKTIYLRINDFTYYFGIKQKRLQYQFNKNLKTCENYLKRNFKDFKLYDSYTINKLPYELQKEILNT